MPQTATTLLFVAAAIAATLSLADSRPTKPEQLTMNYKIVETHGIGPARRETICAGADTLADAIALARSMFNVVDLEIDPLNPRCADFYTACNRVMQIEPYA